MTVYLVSQCLACMGRGRRRGGTHPSGYERCQPCDGVGRVIPGPDGHPRPAYGTRWNQATIEIPDGEAP